jgi:hypothetical protein
MLSAVFAAVLAFCERFMFPMLGDVISFVITAFFWLIGLAISAWLLIHLSRFAYRVVSWIAREVKALVGIVQSRRGVSVDARLIREAAERHDEKMVEIATLVHLMVPVMEENSEEFNAVKDDLKRSEFVRSRLVGGLTGVPSDVFYAAFTTAVNNYVQKQFKEITGKGQDVYIPYNSSIRKVLPKKQPQAV